MVGQLALAVALGLWADAPGPKFYPDDPLLVEPKPRSAEGARRRKLSDIYDLFLHTFGKPGEEQLPGKPIPARAVNTLGEAMDSAWYTNRHYRRRMSIAELVRGAGDGNAPSTEGLWRVLEAKGEGVTPGFLILEAKGRRYLLKFDPTTNPEMATAADVVGSKFFHALGYHVPEYYIVKFRRGQLTIDPKAKISDAEGRERPMTGMDVDEILRKAPRESRDEFRATASYYLAGSPLREFRYYGIRRDDPNDVVPHEHRRDLRGLFVFCAWLGHNDAKSLNSQDSLVDDGHLRYIRHHLIDFSGILG
ncbi:MAG: hypothetical protein ACRD96_00170, partial [Bryobacteraceae bacterium]